MEYTQEMIEKARKAGSVEELLALAKENGYELSKEEAEEYFAQMHKSGELSDEELENVSGGGCRKNGHLVVSVLYSCDYWRCKKDGSGFGRTERTIYNEGTSVKRCLTCGSGVQCNTCQYCKYEKGLWLCYNPQK